MEGYIQVYTGNGKRKTTAALGLTLRAVGAGKKVFFGQFVKRQIYSEIKALQQFPSVQVKQYGLDCCIYNEPTQDNIQAERERFLEISRIINSGKYDIVVLDEASIALYYNLFTVEELCTFMFKNPKKQK